MGSILELFGADLRVLAPRDCLPERSVYALGFDRFFLVFVRSSP